MCIANCRRLRAATRFRTQLVHAGWVRRCWRLPKYVVLVRDMRASLVSNYEKWKQHYGVEFTEYLRGDPSGRRYNSDLWWCLRFMNAWGRVAQRFPAETHVLRYEDLRRDPARELTRVSNFLLLQLAPQQINAAVAAAGKDAMTARHDPARPLGEVSLEERNVEEWFGGRDREFLADVCASQLRHTFGYDYSHNA